MNKNQAYALAKRLAQQLGLPLAPLREAWVGSNTEYWLRRINDYQRQGQNKIINYHEAQRLANLYNIPLIVPNRLQGTTNADWINEIARINEIVRQRARQARQELPAKRDLYRQLQAQAVALGVPLNIRWLGSTNEQIIAERNRLNLIAEQQAVAQRAQNARQQLIQSLSPAYLGSRRRAINILEQQLEARRAIQRDEARQQRQAMRALITARRTRQANNRLLRNGQTTTRQLQDGNQIITIKHMVPQYIRHRITPENLEEIRRQLIFTINRHLAVIANNRFRIGVRDVRRNNNNYMSNTYQEGSVEALVNDLIARHLRGYANGNDSDQLGEGFEIGEITIYIFRVVSLAMGSSTRSLAQASKKWLIISPKTKINCLFQALTVCKNFVNNRLLLEMNEEGQQARVNSGIELKRAIKIRYPNLNDNYADEASIQYACNYLRYPIKLYNNVFELIKEFKPIEPLGRYRGVKEYMIQKAGIHCNALLPREHVSEKYPDYHFPVFEEFMGEQKDENTIIKKGKCFDEYNYKFAAWDIETSQDYKKSHIPYACSIAWFDYQYGEDIIYTKIRIIKGKDKQPKRVEERVVKKNITGREFREKQFWGLSCLKDMTKWIFSQKEIFNGYTLYAHNGGKYDLPLIIKRAFIVSKELIIEGSNCHELNNAWIGFTLRARDDNKFKLRFRDSYRLLPSSLDKLAKEMDVQYKKLKEEVKHDQIRLDNWATFPQLPRYLTHDVFGLLEIIEKFGKGVFMDLGIDITKCYTGASLSKKNFFKNYYNKSTKGTLGDMKNPIYSMNSFNDKFVRDSYFGGRVECFKMGVLPGRCYYYDFTSLYPDVGRNNLPYGLPELVELGGARELPEGFFGWVKALVKTKEDKFDAIPKHAMLKESRLIFPILENWTEMNLFSEELDYDIYEYQFAQGVKFQKGKFKKKFFNDGFLKKSKAKEDGNSAMSQAYKIIINSGYGFWGLRTKDRDGVKIFEPNDNEYLKYLNTDKLTSLKEENGYVFCRVIKDMEVKDFNVAIAAAISSYARSKLHALMTTIKDVGGSVYYSDTDSVICNINLNDYPEIKAKYQWDGDGSELGSLKNELDEKIEKILKKRSLKIIQSETKCDEAEAEKKYDSKTIHPRRAYDKRVFEELVARDGGNLYWDECCITGCKQYALSRQIIVDGKPENIEVVKIKGYSQREGDNLTYQNMVSLANGERLSQTQAQFRCPKSNYVSDTRSYDIRTKNVVKSFKKIYTKGIIQDNGEIRPLRI